MEKYFVCLLDVLGFSKKLETIGLDEMNRMYQVLADRVKSVGGVIWMGPDVMGCLGMCSRDFESHYFSDTILVWTKALGDPTARMFTELIGNLVCDAIEFGLPLRGTITQGEAILSKESNTYLGLPIIEAATVEKEQAWIGVSFGKSVSTREAPLHADTAIAFRSHYKRPEDMRLNCMVIDWPRQWRLSERVGDPRKLVEAMNTSPEHSKYYENTIRFINFSEANHDWYKQAKYREGERFKAG
jgi:hypothetical protein